ncbi:uncharacterized protein LOC120283690 [Dioscorea cayenensis subsp. rotundata]|uniref:Uncharacterized protein LOC120283690 n=1 Tax=Dioscorea cayennensis subsp. rotundata TaxID=55577 RepID=A0AB40D7Q0_DIOCR|nr:uncharacterized protein LOC120283690 [Dioscorea cayenensis subsp. rotundata]
MYMMLRVVLSVLLWIVLVVLSVVMLIFGFVIMMLLVMFWVGFMMVRVGVMILWLVLMIDNDEYRKLQEKIENCHSFVNTIITFHHIMQRVVLMILSSMSRMLRNQLKKKMARVRDNLTKLQERLEMAYRKLEYADEEMMIVPHGTTNTLFHNLRAVSNDLQDISDELSKLEDKLATMDYEEHWLSLFINVYQHLIYFPPQIKSQNKTLKIIGSRLEEIFK